MNRRTKMKTDQCSPNPFRATIRGDLSLVVLNYLRRSWEYTMKMRRSRVLEKLRAGEVVSCFKLNLEGSRAAEIAAMTGFDCVWSDMEHTATDWDTVKKQILATKCHDTDILVRINR